MRLLQQAERLGIHQGNVILIANLQRFCASNNIEAVRLASPNYPSREFVTSHKCPPKLPCFTTDSPICIRKYIASCSSPEALYFFYLKPTQAGWKMKLMKVYTIWLELIFETKYRAETETKLYLCPSPAAGELNVDLKLESRIVEFTWLPTVTGFDSVYSASCKKTANKDLVCF